MRIFKIALLVVFAASTLLGTAGSAIAATECTPIGAFQDDRPSKGFFRYSSDWTNLANYEWGDPKEDTISFTDTKGQGGVWGPYLGAPGTVMFSIRCRDRFDFFYTKASNRGIADIYAYTGIWKFVTSVDQYSPNTRWQSVARINLPSGTTQVAILNSGEANPNNTSGYKYVDLDGITPR